MSRLSQAGIREHLRERNNMDGRNRFPADDVEECVRNHDRLNTPYCPECGKKVFQDE